MTDLIPMFDYPMSEEWLALDANLKVAADYAEDRVSARGGRQNRKYAKAIRQHLEFVWQGTRTDATGPQVVYVPLVPRTTQPVVPATISVRRVAPDHERSMDALVAKMGETGASTEREVTVKDLSVGPACRVREAFSLNAGRSGEVMVENVQHHVLAELYPEEILLLNAHWNRDVMGSGVVELVDQMAASLRVVSPGSGDGPRPVLAAPDARVVFAESQIGRGMRPLAQHGFVVIEQGVLTLLDSDRQPIDSAPLPQVQASKRGITGGAVVALTLANGEKYNVSPGWGAHRGSLSLPGLGNPVKDAADSLRRCVEDGGGTTT
ncbi:hypothetical protein ACTWP5_07065 [Streptomyces sp. 4N509B]|uniref:hypothetical protein n=1 Tax=Streptomyces sp. 4N509B TaxID=3457413 RepID=UPI003FD01955